MAEFVEVMKQLNRICESEISCNECPLKNNGICALHHRYEVKTLSTLAIAQAEEIIMAWAKEHPVQTNADKFKEVFGCGFDFTQKGFWDMEYKEPKE